MISTSIRRVSRAPALRRALTSQSKAFEPTAPKIFGNFTNVSLALTFGAVSVGGYMLSDSKAVVACESESDGRSVLALSLNEAKESATGIAFPGLCDGQPFCGAGVRVKYGFVKVYAVGIYSNGKSIEELLDQNTDITIRIVMNRGLSVEKYTAAIAEALEPRMKGEDMHKLEDFKKLQPPGDMPEGAENVMTIKGDTMHFRSSLGGLGSIKSSVLCAALRDVYLGADPVSPALKKNLFN